MAEHFKLQLKDSYMLSDSCRHMVFQLQSGEALDYVPGQFIQIHFEDRGDSLKRSYSIGTRFEPGQQTQIDLEIAVSYVEGGAATALLSALKEGDLIDASGPYGRFCLAEDSAERVVLIATGTGVTPYRAMAAEILERHAATGQTFVLLFGARTRKDLLYADDFRALEKRCSGFSYVPCLSRVTADDLLEGEAKGYVQSQLPELAISDQSDLIFLCGNPEMIDETFGYLKEKGLPVKNIRREKYISPRRR